MKQKGQRKLPFFYHWKLSRKLLLLFFGIGILPITVIFGITLYRMVQKSSQMQLYTMDKNFDRMEQTMDNIQDRIGRIGSLVTVSDQVGDALRSDDSDGLVQELQKFDALSDYTYQLELSSDDISILYYIPEKFLISQSGNTCYRPLNDLTKWKVDAQNLEQTAGASWRVVHEKNRYGQKKSYLANFRAIWNTEQYSELLGIVAVMIPVDAVRDSMNGMMDQQTLYLLDENDTILLSGGSQKISGERLPKLEGTSGDTHVENGAWLVRNKKLEEGGMALVSIVPRNVLMQESGKIIREMLIFYIIVCGISFVLLQLGTRPFLGRIRKLDTTMEAVDQGIMEQISVPEYRDELGRLTQRYNKMVEQIQHLLEEQYVLGKEKSEAQLYALQAQISPHFLYNTLDMMNWMAVKGETDNIRSVLSSMSRFYRMVLSRGAYIITIGEEIRMCQAYMEIQVMRKKKKLQFLLDVDEEVFPYLIPKITLQPLLENAVSHGIDEKDGGRGTVRLSGRLMGDEIVLQVQDDGVGMDPKMLDEASPDDGKTHYGLSNVKTRLMIFYEKNAEVICNSAPGIGTAITLKFPKKEDMEEYNG